MHDDLPPLPFAGLTPDAVLTALAAVGLRGDGRLLALHSFENRVYLAHLEEPVQGHSAVVLKVYRPQRWSDAQIEEEHAFALELAAQDVAVVAPLVLQGASLHRSEGWRFAVWPRRGGRRPELDDPEVLQGLGRFIARLHRVGAQRPFLHRPRLTRTALGEQTVQWLLSHDVLPPEVRRRWAEAATRALATVAEVAPDLDEPAHHIRVHGDCHPGNILWTPEGQAGAGPHVVDLDDARNAAAVQDLWMLLPGGPRAEQLAALSALLEGYEQVHRLAPRQLAWIEPLRTLRLIHYAGWLAQRAHDPAFATHFAWFGSAAYWSEQAETLQAQIEAMQAPPWDVLAR